MGLKMVTFEIISQREHHCLFGILIDLIMLFPIQIQDSVGLDLLHPIERNHLDKVLN